jgi:hypothetical protein
VRCISQVASFSLMFAIVFCSCGQVPEWVGCTAAVVHWLHGTSTLCREAAACSHLAPIAPPPSQAFLLAFGPYLRDFSTFGRAMMTLFRA